MTTAEASRGSPIKAGGAPRKPSVRAVNIDARPRTASAPAMRARMTRGASGDRAVSVGSTAADGGNVEASKARHQLVRGTPAIGGMMTEAGGGIVSPVGAWVTAEGGMNDIAGDGGRGVIAGGRAGGSGGRAVRGRLGSRVVARRSSTASPGRAGASGSSS